MAENENPTEESSYIKENIFYKSRRDEYAPIKWVGKNLLWISSENKLRIKMKLVKLNDGLIRSTLKSPVIRISEYLKDTNFISIDWL